MSIPSPHAYHKQFEAAFNRGDGEALLSMFTEPGLLVADPASPSGGAAAIAGSLGALLRLRGSMRLDTVFVYECGDVALTRGAWELDGRGSDGQPIHLEGKSIEVLRRQPDGTWKVAIDAPFGAV